MSKKLPYIGFPYLLINPKDLEKWCDQYELEPWSIQCDTCGETRNVNIPFASKEHNRRGLLAYLCSCGKASFSMVGDDLQKLTQPIEIPYVPPKPHLRLVSEKEEQGK